MYLGDFELAAHDFDQAWMLLESMAEPASRSDAASRRANAQARHEFCGGRVLDKTIAHSRDGTSGFSVIRIAHLSE